MVLSSVPGYGVGAGFQQPVLASQSVFRVVMDALARPGSVQTLDVEIKAPEGLNPATAAIALTLFDQDTTVWLNDHLAAMADVGAWLRFQASSPITSASVDAAFAVIDDGAELPDLSLFARGSLEYPDRSTTLIVQVDTLNEGAELVLHGPGICDMSSLRAATLPSDFVERMQANHALFPLGVDLLLTCGTQLVGLPRSTRVSAREI